MNDPITKISDAIEDIKENIKDNQYKSIMVSLMEISLDSSDIGEVIVETMPRFMYTQPEVDEMTKVEVDEMTKRLILTFQRFRIIIWSKV